MATQHTQVKGTYHQKSEDSSHQASNKFTKSYAKPTDNLPKPSSKAMTPKDSSESKVGSDY